MKNHVGFDADHTEKPTRDWNKEFQQLLRLRATTDAEKMQKAIAIGASFSNPKTAFRWSFRT